MFSEASFTLNNGGDAGDGGVFGETTRLQFLKQDIERHNFGERRRITMRIGMSREHYLAGMGVYGDGGEFRIGRRLRLRNA